LKARGNPYVTVVIVWIVSSLALASVVSLPVTYVVLLSVVLLIVLLVVGYLTYKARRTGSDSRDPSRNLSSDLRRFSTNVLQDFGFVAGRVSAWWLRREVRIQSEMAQERERKARKREKMEQLEQKRRARSSNGYSTAARERKDAPQRGSREEETEG
jgi:uncharacterized iron-regulated membrane protein